MDLHEGQIWQRDGKRRIVVKIFSPWITWRREDGTEVTSRLFTWYKWARLAYVVT